MEYPSANLDAIEAANQAIHQFAARFGPVRRTNTGDAEVVCGAERMVFSLVSIADARRSVNESGLVQAVEVAIYDIATGYATNRCVLTRTEAFPPCGRGLPVTWTPTLRAIQAALLP